MSKIIDTAIGIVKNEITNVEYRLSDDLLFGIVCYKYFFNNARFDITDLKSSFTDGANDGGIDLIAVSEDDFSSKSLVLIQSKNIADFNSKDEIKDIFTKMSQTVADFQTERIGSYNKNLRRIYREKYDDASDDPNFSIKLVLFLNTNKPDEYKEKILEHLGKIGELEDFEFSIYYQNEIEQQIEIFEDRKRFVPEGKINIYKDHGYIKNGENGLLVDVSALSIRKLWDLYRDKGLFEQNFRYFVPNQKIDDQIEQSLRNKREKFWFLNNGIIIGCEQFEVDGDNVKLWNFSIVNGCQTTTKLGKYSGSNEDLDFPITCKIVKPDQLGEDYFNIFISEIAEASNSQKPISDRDLKSNQPEQRKLQRDLKQDDPKIFLEIKRGEGILRRKNIETWRKVKNDTLGQLILSILLQQPGTARSSKSKIFSDRSFYNRIFKRNHDKDTIVDILKLSSYYDDFIKVSNYNEIASNVAKNGKLCVLAIIGFLVKNNRKLINLNLDTNKGEWVIDVTSDNLNGNLFSPNRPDDYVRALNSLFNQIILSLSHLYNSRGESESSVTNFFKTDKKYFAVILEHIKSSIILDEWEYVKLKEKLENVFL